eukprot:GEMP01076079.1.p2 GENE.GEMP01076079.1~~GEMP01076079.1.p2  ORF type:complete len:104 (-),score=7.88 GEMP01076079.1:49-360(-)
MSIGSGINSNSPRCVPMERSSVKEVSSWKSIGEVKGGVLAYDTAVKPNDPNRVRCKMEAELMAIHHLLGKKSMPQLSIVSVGTIAQTIKVSNAAHDMPHETNP